MRWTFSKRDTSVQLCSSYMSVWDICIWHCKTISYCLNLLHGRLCLVWKNASFLMPQIFLDWGVHGHLLGLTSSSICAIYRRFQTLVSKLIIWFAPYISIEGGQANIFFLSSYGWGNQDPERLMGVNWTHTEYKWLTDAQVSWDAWFVSF